MSMTVEAVEEAAEINTACDEITRRPKALLDLPFYKSLPSKPIAIDWACGSMDELLKLDILSLDGVQPTEDEHFKVNGGIVYTDPTEESLRIYERRKAEFQYISVVVNSYAIKDAGDFLQAKPYRVSLFPFSKRGKVQTVTTETLRSIPLSIINKDKSVYIGFNPFNKAYGFFAPGGLLAGANIESDMIGFVDNTFALVTSFNHNKVKAPFVREPNIANEFNKYRNRTYFKEFNTVKARKVWGCDSPIELFLLQAMDSIDLSPMIQVIIGEDGYIASSYHTLWGDKVLRKRFKIITEADFYFPENRLAVFCDSKEFHSSDRAIEKDKLIDEKLRSIGIKSLRIYGRDIVESPIDCARQVELSLN